MRAFQGGQVPVGKGDGDAEDQREHHHRDDEQHRGQDKEHPLTLLAPQHHLAPAKADGPDHIGVKHRPPVGEADVQNVV